MKSKYFLSLGIMALVFALCITACYQEEDVKLPVSQETDDMQKMITPQPALPDLVFDSYNSTLPITQGPCPGDPQGNAACTGGGVTSFNFNAVIRNRSNVALPPGQFTMCWYNFGGPGVFQTINHAGIAGQGTLAITSPTFNIPCPGGPPPYALVTEVYYAEVDCTDVVNEFRENNNFSRRLYICTNQ